MYALDFGILGGIAYIISGLAGHFSSVLVVHRMEEFGGCRDQLRGHLRG